MKKTTIVGAGIGGLMTALYLSKQKDRDITILEKNSHAGGRMTFETHEESKIDQGPTIVLLPSLLLELMEAAGIEKSRIPLIPMEPMYHVHFPDGTTFRKFQSEEKQLEEFSSVFPEEREGFLEFLKEMGPYFEMGKSRILGQTFADKKKFFHPDILKLLWGMKAYKSLRAFMSKYFISDMLLDSYSLQSLYIGGNPSKSPSIYSFIALSEHLEGIWYVKGGYAHLIDILTEELERRGVEIQTNTEVQHILIEKEKAVGVQTADGERRFDEVIYNGDFPLMDTMLPERLRLNKTYTPSSGCLLFYIGTDKIYSDQPVHQFFMTDNFRSHMKEVFETKQVPDTPSIYAFHPSVVDESLAPEGKGVLYVLVPVPADTSINYEKEGVLSNYVIDILEEKAFPHLRQHIEWWKIRTPKDAEISGLYEGGSFGIGPTLGQSGMFRPQFRPYPVENLYAVGASIHPGGGVPIVMQGAKLLADELSKEVMYN
ncbi:phytoene desaturase family protein [Salimicrobium halophilum]|uniref:Phytoene desaturase n=1 Tax=Salimicrobium halophilum TaxID=86666 RepID=A0A1G8RNE1_9BACI|nr:phytoene desaturase family protein [Salimicrobium halophilum]SDJ18459.1 phytoene desaturase [Salimicrobium halophilum]